jgi:hypothetical protein
MKTIEQIWSELTSHPDFVTGSLWTVQDVATQIECEVESYLDENQIEITSPEHLESISLSVVRQGKDNFDIMIRDWEASTYQYDSWSGGEIINKVLDVTE